MKRMLKGYHYTSEANWKNIQKEGGMKRYAIKKEELLRYFPKGVSGIWLWETEPKGVSHAGNIMYQGGVKGSPKIVKLEVGYDEDKVLRHYGSKVELFHSGSVENWDYHYRDKGIIIQQNIPLKNIRLIGSYNIVQRLK